MGVYKRAFLYVKRKKVRSILLFLIFFVTGLFLLVGNSIKQSAKEAAGEFQKTLTTGLMVEQKMINPETIWEITLNEKGEEIIKFKVPLMMEEHIEEFLAIEGVSGFYCDSMERRDAYTGLEVHPAFINGAVELVEGRHVAIRDVAKVVISDELAERNGLKIGDKIEARNSDIFTGEFYGSVYEVEIVGIFHINFEQEVIPDRTYEPDILANTLFCTPDIDYWSRHEYQVQHGMDVWAPESDKRLFTIVLFVEEPSLLESVKEKLLAIDLVDWSYYNMETYDKDYQTAAAPLLSMIKICNLLAVIPAIGILVILFLVLMIWMRSRRYEVRILTSIGVKKNAVLLQFLMECCGIATAAFIVAFLLAGPTTKLVGDGLQTLFYASDSEEAYEVVTPLEVTTMDINLLPPAKGDTLPYTVIPIEACTVFLFLEGTAVLSVIVSSAKMLKRT